MPNVLPRTRLDKIEWFEGRLGQWLADPASIGLTPAQVDQLAAEVAAARAAHEEAERARNAAQSATLAFHTRAAAMEGDGRGLIAQIKAFAEATGDRGVYTRSDVPPPRDPSPSGPPESPTDLRGRITSDGAVELTWEGSLARRTFYEVLRRLAGEEAWTVLDSVGAKRYLDSTVPPGTSRVQYRVRAKRGTRTSPSALPIEVGLGVARRRIAPGLAA